MQRVNWIKLNKIHLFLLAVYSIAINVNFKFCTTLFVLIVVISLILKRNNIGDLRTGIDLKYLFFSGSIVFMDVILLLLHPIQDESIYIFRKDIQYYLMMLLIIFIINKYDEIKYICYGFLISGIVVPVYTIYLNLQGIVRAGGLMDSNVNVFSTQLLILLPMVMFSGWYIRENKYFKLVSMLSSILILYSLLQAASRGAFLTIIVGSAVMMVILFRNKLKALLYCGFILLSIMFFLWLSDAVLITRLLKNMSLNSYENILRINIYTNSIEMFLNNWFSGVGIGQYSSAYYFYMFNDNPIKQFYHAHNWLLMYMAEGGIIGASAFFVFCGGHYWFYYKKLINDDEIVSKAAMVALCIFVFVNIYMLFEYTMYVPGIKRLFFCELGFIYAVIKINDILEHY